MHTFLIMGKNFSKEQINEHVVIAQNGGNMSHWEEKMDKFAIFILVLLVLLAGIIVYCVYKKFHTGLKAWVRRQATIVLKAQPPKESVPSSSHVEYA